uniref:Uncharacterized protein n=1 Tax=Aegilops tauschii TaxID=37682 RepID=M8AZC8_AEGTA
MAAVLLRKLLSPDDLFQLWPLLSPDGQAALKSNLVNASGSAAATLTELAAAAHSYLHRAGVPKMVVEGDAAPGEGEKGDNGGNGGEIGRSGASVKEEIEDVSMADAFLVLSHVGTRFLI